MLIWLAYYLTTELGWMWWREQCSDTTIITLWKPIHKMSVLSVPLKTINLLFNLQEPKALKPTVTHQITEAPAHWQPSVLMDMPPTPLLKTFRTQY